MGSLERKKIFRRELTRKKKLLSQQEFVFRNQLVSDRLLEVLSEIWYNGIHSYLPINRKKEPETMQVLQKLREEGKYILISKSNFETMEMKHFIMDAELILEENSYGIPEPKAGNIGSLSKIEVILVPLLAADRAGNRIGYGKGFYDRLLADIRDDILKIGLCIGPLFDRFDFVEPHDIKLDYCITPFETVKY